MTVPADPKERRLGPRWGLLQKDGQVFCTGLIYAPYLSGDKTYAGSNYDRKTWFRVNYLGECGRKAGWHKWAFDLDAEKGLTVSFDGKDVNAARKRLDWNKTTLAGFVGVVIYGDEAKGKAQTVWVDDVSVTLGGPMKVKPVPPPPPPPVVPAKDPPVAKPAKLVDAVKGKHPRLLFGAEDIPALKAFARGAGKAYFDELVKYVPVSKPPKSMCSP